MAVKDAQEVTDLNQDVEIIRDILFGKHLQTLSNQLNSLEETVSSLKQLLETENKARKEEAQAGMDQITKVQKDLEREIKDLTDQVGRQIEQENQTTKKALDGFKKDLDEQIKQLQGESGSQEAQLSNLIGTLASALADFQKQNPVSEPSTD